MAPQLYFPYGQHQDEIRDEEIQMANACCAPGAFAPPPGYLHFQSGPWQQQQPDGEMDMAAMESWETHRIANIIGPVMFDWYTSAPVGPWDTQQEHDVSQHHVFEGGYSEPLLKFEKTFEQSEIWQHTPWMQMHDTSRVVDVSEDGSGHVEFSVPDLARDDSLDRASKRRRRSSTSTEEMQSAAPMMTSTHMPPMTRTPNFEAPEPRPYAPTPAFIFPDYTSSTGSGPAQIHPGHAEYYAEGLSPIISAPNNVLRLSNTPSTSPAPVFQSSPTFMPSVRVISDRRDSTPNSRRASHAVFKTQSANTKRGHYASEVWEGHKAAIKKMYIDEGKTLREVISAMEKDHNFPAT